MRGDPLADSAAEGEPDEMYGLEFERIEESDDIAGEIGNGVGARRHR